MHGLDQDPSYVEGLIQVQLHGGSGLYSVMSAAAMQRRSRLRYRTMKGRMALLMRPVSHVTRGGPAAGDIGTGGEQ